MSRAAAAASATAARNLVADGPSFPNSVLHPPPSDGLIAGDGTSGSEAAWFDFLLQAIRPPDAAAMDGEAAGAGNDDAGPAEGGGGGGRARAASLPAMPEMVLQQIAVYLAVPDLIR